MPLNYMRWPHWLTTRFGCDTLTLASANALSQLIPVIAAPVLTRLFTPGEHGIFNGYTAILNVLAAVASFRYEMAIPLPLSRRVALGLVGVSLSLTVVSALVVAVPIIGMHACGLDLSARWPVWRYLWLLPMALLLTGAWNVFSSYAVRKQAFGEIAQTRISRAAALTCSQLGFGAFSLGSVGLVLGDLLGRFAGMLRLIQPLRRDWLSYPGAIRVRVLLVCARRYRTFALHLAPAAVLNVAAISLPVVVFSLIYGDQAAGWFGLSVRVVALPIMFLIQAVTQVFQGQFAEAVRGRQGQELARLFHAAIKRLALVALAPLILIAATSQWLVPFVFGPAWAPVATILQLLAPMLLLQLVVSPVSIVLPTLRKSSWQLGWDIARTAALGGVFVGAFFLHWDLMAAVAAYSAVLSVSYLALFFLCRGAVSQALAAQNTV